MNETRRSQAEGLQFLTNYRSAFTTRPDGSSWPKFERTWHNAARYFRGLLRPGSNTVTDIAEKMYADQERLERFVRESPWGHENVEDELRERVPEAIQGHDAALIIDGMPIPKSGEDTVGVVRQWCSVIGKVDTCQVTVNCTLASPGEQHNSDQLTWPLGMRLYLPKKWAGAPDAEYDDQHERELFAQRREDANLPENIEHRTKIEIAEELVEDVVSADIDHGCVVADSRYGEARSFRQELRALDEPYLLEVPTGEFNFVPEDTELLHPEDHPARKHRAYPEEISAKTPEELADEIDDDDWTEVTWNKGTKETMSGEFYRTRIRTVTRKSNRWVSDETGWLLLKKDHGGSDDDEEGERKAWVCWDVDGELLEQLVSWSQARWSVEQFHRDIKQNLGADEYQGRTWKGTHHHLAVVMLAHAFVVRRRLETGTNHTDFSTFEEVINDIVHESAIQGLMEDKGCDRARAEELAEYMLRGYSPW